MCSLAVMLRPGLIFCYAIGVLSLFNKDCGSFLMMKITITDCRNKRSQSRTSTNKCRESCPIVNTRQVSLLIIHCLLTKTITTFIVIMRRKLFLVLWPYLNLILIHLVCMYDQIENYLFLVINYELIVSRKIQLITRD